MDTHPDDHSQSEIERKFLVQNSPLGEALAGTEILQAYVAVGSRSELRVRIVADSAVLTFKGPRRGSVRLEWEVAIPLAIAEELYREAKFGQLQKVRHPVVGPDGHLWSIDVFKGQHEGLELAEVELERPDEVVTLPAWIGREVTDDEAFYNRNLAMR